jgi:hypothetical protein
MSDALQWAQETFLGLLLPTLLLLLPLQPLLLLPSGTSAASLQLQTMPGKPEGCQIMSVSPAGRDKVPRPNISDSMIAVVSSQCVLPSWTHVGDSCANGEPGCRGASSTWTKRDVPAHVKQLVSLNGCLWGLGVGSNGGGACAALDCCCTALSAGDLPMGSSRGCVRSPPTTVFASFCSCSDILI